MNSKGSFHCYQCAMLGRNSKLNVATTLILKATSLCSCSSVSANRRPFH